MTPQPTFSVVLRADLPGLERELLRQYCHELHGADGHTLLQLPCTRVDTTHAIYLEVEALAPKSRRVTMLRLPHAFVLLIETLAAEDAAGLAALPR